MKLLRCGNKGKEKPCVLDEDNQIRDISSIVSDFVPSTLNFSVIEKIKNSNIKSLPEIHQSTRIGSCIAKPGKFIGIGLNYSDHAEETGAKPPSEPIVFMKATSCLSGPYDDVIIPKNAKKTDWEVEIAFVVGKEAKYISEKDAQNYILGYCIVNDVSERENQIERMGQWVKGKSADTFGPTGPFLVTKEDIPNTENLKLELKINGKKMQSGNTSKMIFNMNFILSYLSHFMSLQPGDIITTGTPSGVGMAKKPPIFLKSGDEIELAIDNLGTQHQKVK
jgi:2-keto-4-pentenoate hydratase/2-oxohepta-3-ene-1,7-dioic acid hydratase in catechol pathway